MYLWDWDRIQYEFVVRPERLTKIEKALYQRIFNPVNTTNIGLRA